MISHKFGFGFLESWALNSKLFAYFTGNWIVKSINKLSNNSEGLWDNSSNFSTMVSSLSNLNFKVNDADSSEGTGHPELIVVKSSRVHAE